MAFDALKTENGVDIFTQCPFCNETDIIHLTDDEYSNYQRWQRRELLIQHALPEKSNAVREQLKTGICPSCWLDMFK